MYKLLKLFLFSLSPEKAHHFTMDQLSLLVKLPGMAGILKQFWGFQDEILTTKRMGLEFTNPVGLAAGFDKNGSYVPSMSTLGFGFIEAGTVTPRPQPGNDLPRLFRLPSDQALINRMGFNNRGVDILVEHLSALKPSPLVVGGNIGKNKITPNAEAVNDYLTCFKKLYDHVDYFVVNVSSPNTPGLRSLQEKKPLSEILSTLQTYKKSQSRSRPLLLKISPDLSFSQLDDVLEVVSDQKLDGLIATNTTLSRDDLKTDPQKLLRIGQGGLSGAPLHQLACKSIAYVRKHSPKDFTIIGVGGVQHPDDALRLMDQGADLLQLYTGLIYQGPNLVGQINRTIAELRRRDS
ncbi:MAG: quinone-dependent dihydroorotate dehydrogenase [Saprospiraceae bacterium]|nr:quinone-dependent dihydroorotate dehydrogenase [Saprospiraceae bacterium]